ncbi:dihydroorotase [Peptoniphilus raoultii]|uniref:dihydroorotase n=1 Tax=Peptoniphilus raoultii TaxID=1776387 RepID=UPI0008D96D0F|nr:dihydroorotase [Peptoniphilus raoultii]
MLIKNGRIIDPENNIDEICDLQIKDGKIFKIGKIEDQNDEILDAKGLIVAPGFCDVHVHFRDPGYTYKEDLQTGSLSAIAGGFTSVICMANTNPIMDDGEKIKDFYQRAKDLPLKVYTVSALTKNFKDRELVDMEKVLEAGAVGFTDDGIPNKNSNLLLEAMKKTKELNSIIAFHEEDPYLISENGINHGKISDHFKIYGSPSLAESSFIARDVEYALYTGAKIDIQHISTKRGVDLIRYGKSKGANIFAEVTPHHLSLTDEALLKYGANAKMNPPLRSEEDRLRVLEGIKDGTLEIIATDHAPHSKEEKSGELIKAPSGIIGLETSLGLCYKNLVEEKIIDIKKLIEIMSLNPCRKYNLPGGSLKIGESADITIFDTNMEYSLDKFYSKSSNTPFINYPLKARTIYTIYRGKIVYDLKKSQIGYSFKE